MNRLGSDFDGVLTAARAGAPWAHARIFSSYSSLIRGYVHIRNAAEADDLTSEVFISVIDSIRTFTGDEDSFRAWLLTIARRRAVDELRRRGRRPVTEPLDGSHDHPAPDDVETAVQTALATQRVVALCDQLTDDQRDVLLLRILGQVTIEEVATTLGKTPGAVKALQRRAFQAIERLLRPGDTPPGLARVGPILEGPGRECDDG